MVAVAAAGTRIMGMLLPFRSSPCLCPAWCLLCPLLGRPEAGSLPNLAMLSCSSNIMEWLGCLMLQCKTHRQVMLQTCKISNLCLEEEERCWPGMGSGGGGSGLAPASAPLPGDTAGAGNGGGGGGASLFLLASAALCQ